MDGYFGYNPTGHIEHQSLSKVEENRVGGDIDETQSPTLLNLLDVCLLSKPLITGINPGIYRIYSTLSLIPTASSSLSKVSTGQNAHAPHGLARKFRVS
jgi:hypothetical protein